MLVVFFHIYEFEFSWYHHFTNLQLFSFVISAQTHKFVWLSFLDGFLVGCVAKKVSNIVIRSVC